jgi:hypothetical protein
VVCREIVAAILGRRGEESLDTEQIINGLREELHRIDSAIAALDGGRGGIRTMPTNGKRRLPEAAKKRMSEAAKARWAKVKKAGGNRL